MACVDENALAAYLRQELAPDAAREVEAHLDACGECRRTAAVVMRLQNPDAVEDDETKSHDAGGGGPAPGPGPLDRGTVLDRYVVLERVGAGGMGIVYAAYDPRLDRRVALKVLNTARIDGRRLADARVRLQREAQVMAKIDHPNVAKIYDAGEAGGRLYLAMEFLPGGTLRARHADPSRSTDEIVADYVGAARGLAAAHLQRIVHRDFKPGNVLLAADGTPRVTDFGVAAFVNSVSQNPELVNVTASAAQPSTPGHTQPGEIPGTPFYLAPELNRGGRATHASDQYSFGVSLFMSLYGHHPSQPPPRAPPRRPAALKRVVDRALAAEPGDRYPSMAALAKALGARSPAAVRTRLLLTAPLVLSAIAVAATVGVQARADHCGVAGEPADALRRDARAVVASVLVPMDARQGSSAAVAVSEALERHAHAWSEAAVGSCRSGESNEGRLARARYLCLTDSLHSAQSYLGWLGSVAPDDPLLPLQRLLELLPPEVCAAATAAEAGAGDPADAAHQRVRQRLLELSILQPPSDALDRELADLEKRLDPRRDVLELARAAELQVRLSLAESSACSAELASSARRAVALAQVSNHPALQARSWLSVVRCDVTLGRLGEASWALDMAAAPLASLPETSLVALDHLRWSVRVFDGLGKVDAARTAAAERRRRTELLFGQRHWAVGEALVREADTDLLVSDYADAERKYRTALGLLTVTLGPDHRITHVAAQNHAYALMGLYRYDEAVAALEPLAMNPVYAAPERSRLRTAIESDLAVALLAVGRASEALAYGRASIAWLGERDARLFAAGSQELHAWARTELEAGDAAKVLRRMQLAREMESTSEDIPPNDAERRLFEAWALVCLGRAAEALPVLDDAAKRLEGVQRGVQGLAEEIVAMRARALLASSRVSEAQALVEKLPQAPPFPLDPMRLAEVRVLVAEASVARHGPGDVAVAAALARTATALAAAAGSRAEPVSRRAAAVLNRAAAAGR